MHAHKRPATQKCKGAQPGGLLFELVRACLAPTRRPARQLVLRPPARPLRLPLLRERGELGLLPLQDLALVRVRVIGLGSGLGVRG